MKLGMSIFASVALVFGRIAGSVAWAQETPDDETVFVTDVNNVVYQISNGQAFPQFTINGSNFRDLVVTDDLKFIIANHTQSGTLLLSDETGANTLITASIKFPEGLDLGPDGALYVSTESFPKIYRLTRDFAGCPLLGPACPNGGYSFSGAPLLTVGGGAKLIADVAVVWSDPADALQPGDILVLVGKPAFIKRYSSTGSFLGVIAVDFKGEQPSAMTFGPNGTILVTTEQGSIWQFATSGGAPLARITGLGGKARGIVFGTKDGAAAAFVSIDPKKVQRYGFTGGVIQSPPTEVVASFNNPRGVSFAGAGGAPLRSGTNVAVQTPAGLTTYQSVGGDGGQADADCYFFERAPGHTGFFLSSVSSLPAFLRQQLQTNDIWIPTNVQGFVPEGRTNALYRLCVTKTTADVQGIKEIASDEETWLGRDLGCPLDAWGGVTMHANSFYAPEVGKGEYPIVDWKYGKRVVQNVTEGCGSDTSWSRGRGSLVLLSAQDTTPRTDLVANSLHLFDTAVAYNSTSVIGGLRNLILNSTLLSNLQSSLYSAKKAASKGKYADVVTKMSDILDVVDAAATGDFKPTGTPVGTPIGTLPSPDVRAELSVRAAAVRFQACTVLKAKGASLPSDCTDLASSSVH
jgi:hypothetical protein